MDTEFIPYEQALALKELGFDQPCIACYTPIEWLKDKPYRLHGHYVNQFKEFFNSKLKEENVATPLYQQAFRWFREKHNLIGLVDGGYDNSKNIFTYVIWNDFRDDIFDDYYSIYEEAELACLIKLIELIK